MPPVTEGEHDDETPFSHSSDEDGTTNSYHHHGRHPSAGGFNASGAISGTAPNEFAELETESSPSTSRGGGFSASVTSPTVLGPLRAANGGAAAAGAGSDTTMVPPPLLPAQGMVSPGKTANDDGQGIARQSSWSQHFSFRGRASTAGGIADAARGSSSTQSPGSAAHPTPSAAGTGVDAAAGLGPASPGHDATAPSRLSVIASPGSDVSAHGSHRHHHQHHHHHHHHGGGHRTRPGRARTSTVGDIGSVLDTDTHATDASILLLSSLGHMISDGISSLQEAVTGGGAAGGAAGGARGRAGTDATSMASTGQVHDAARRACAAFAANGSPPFPAAAPGSPGAAAGTGISSATSSSGSASSGIVAGSGAAGRSPAQADSYYAVTHRDMGGKGGISLSVTFDLAAAGSPAAPAPAAAAQELPPHGTLQRSLSAESGLRLSSSGVAPH